MKLTLLKELGRMQYGKGTVPFGLYRCGCGNEIKRNMYTVKSGDTTQCRPCSQKQQSKSITTHGMSGTRLNTIWRKMKDRCHNVKSDNYVYYGERGIRVCKTRHNFEPFMKLAMNNGYIEDLKTGVGSRLEETTKKTGSLLGGLKDQMVSILPWRR